MSVTMADLARAARVSRATVSLALRNRPEIPEATRRRIQQLAKQLNYKPNPLVSALMATRRQNRTSYQSTLGFVTNHETRDGWKQNSSAYWKFYDGARTRALALGYELQDFWLREPGMSSSRLRAILQARGIRALIVAPLPIENAALPAFDWSTFAVVTLGYSVREPDFHRVSHDYFHGITTALSRCRARGYRRIGFFIDRRVSLVVFNLWHAAYLAEQKTTIGVEPIEPLLGEIWSDPRIRPWIKRNRLDALVSLDVWRMQAASLLPSDLTVVSLNADESPVPVAGISRDFNLLGEAAVDRLISLLHGGHCGIPTRAQTLLIEGMWVNDELLGSVAGVGGRLGPKVALQSGS